MIEHSIPGITVVIPEPQIPDGLKIFWGLPRTRELAVHPNRQSPSFFR